MILSRFSDLSAWAEAFAVGEFSSVLCIGRRGLSKTTTFTNALESELGPSESQPGDPWLYVSARLSPFEMYRQAFLFRDRPLLIDDVDALLKDRQAVALLKSLMQDELPRRVSWYTDSFGADEDIPHTFTTSSPVCILANDIGAVNANLEAVLDRAKVLEFNPTVDEVLTQCATWFDDEVVLQFVRDWQSFIGAGLLTMRQLKHARDFRRSTRVVVDWEADLLVQWNIDTTLIAAYRALTCPDAKTTPQRVAVFQANGGTSQATMFRHFAMLKEGRRVFGSHGRKIGRNEVGK